MACEVPGIHERSCHAAGTSRPGSGPAPLPCAGQEHVVSVVLSPVWELLHLQSRWLTM